MTGLLIKICPACGHVNDLAEIFCAGIAEEDRPCSYNLLDVEATQEGQQPTVSGTPPPASDASDLSPQASAESLDSNGLSRVCLNGHPLEEGDLLCLTCGAVPASQLFSETIVSEPEPASASWQGETLADLPEAQRRDPALLRALLAELDGLLYRLQLEGGTHEDLQPDQIRLVSRQPLRLQLAAGAGQSSTPPSSDLTNNPTSPVGLYSAPERLVGIQSPNSDWWGLGLLILEWLVGPSFWQGVHQQAWQLRVITDGVPIPDTVTDPWRSLLMGLLTRDPNDRWGHSEVIRWLDGDEEIPLLVEEPQVGDEGSIIRLAGQRYRSPDRYALAAAQAEVWDEAQAQLQQGELLTWLEQNNLPADSLAEVKRLAADESLDQDERLMLVLLLLNRNLPLCLRGEVIGAGNLAADPQRARAWLSGVLPGRLRRIGRHTWLADLTDRREAALEQARTLRLNLAEARFDAAALIGDRRRLEQAWAERRQEWPAALHNGLSNLISRSRQSEEQLLLLVSAELDQFRSAADVLKEAERLAKQSKVAGRWDQAAARRWLTNSQRDIFRALQEHVADFVRCGERQPDDWADQFRSDQRLALPQALVLLSIPQERWIRPEGGEHWQRLLQFFRRRVLSGIQRGPLLALSVRPGGKRVDLAELTSKALPASTLIDHLVSRQARPRSLDPALLDANPQLSQRLRRLRQDADAYQRETGISALYLGYPLLVRRDQAPNTGTLRKPKLIPLLLWPVRLSITGQGNLPQLAYDRDHGSGDGIRLNPAVEGVLSHQQNQALQEAMEELQQRSALTGAQVVDVLRTVFAGPEGILERCPQSLSLPAGSDAQLLPSGVLFLCSFSAQTLAHELEQLERRPSLEGPMAALLRLTPDSPPIARSSGAPSEHERYLVTPADPSQKRAIWASRQQPGVLIQGPPGTGKSQTIVNIVADAVGRHERVLVVCQKQAALDVVRNRLEAAQLGDRLCLITDPSSDRRPLLKKLREALESWDPSRRRDEFARERLAIATDVTRLENELDGLYRAMATPLVNSGLNDQQVIDGLLQLGNDPKVPDLTALRPLLQNCHVEEVRTIARQCADIASLWLRAQPEDSPLAVLRTFSTDESNLNTFSNAFKQLQEVDLDRAKDLSESSDVLESTDPKAVQDWIDSHASTLQAIDDKLAALLTRWMPLFGDGSGKQIRDRLDALGLERSSIQEPGVSLRWQAVLQPNTDAELVAISKAATIWINGRSSLLRLVNPGFHRARALLQKRIPEALNDDSNLIASLQTALAYEIQLRRDCRRHELLRRDLGLPQNVVNLRQQELLSTVDLLIEQLDRGAAVVQAARQCPLQLEANEAVRSGRSERISTFIHNLQCGVRRQELRQRSQSALNALSIWFEQNWIESLKHRINEDQPIGVELEAIAQSYPTLVDYQLYRSRAASLSANEQLVMGVLARERSHWQAVASEHLAETVRITVEREALLGWRAAAEAREPALLLTRQDVDRRIKRLAGQDAHLLDLNRRMTATPAAPERVQPRPNWDDIVMLQGPRARKLREVVELGEERGLFEICPVWLANPETVSQIFPLRQGLFDLVIFDEASQLPVENALPAMYRANRIVISGDEKQLPPTRFFSSGFADESDEEFNPDADGDDPDVVADAVNAAETRRQVKDCGDLLVLASAAGLTHVSLDIHYRSRFRPLIAHSNAAFYQNKLSVPVLHPAEEIRRTRPLQVEVINGTYANQSNRDEATALIAFLEDLWCGPNAVEPETLPTVGVVTFNKTQADLIEDLLDRFTQTNPQFQQVLERERQRRFQGEDCGFFVKNLENVQGDERDWILFSTTFGRDESGRFMRRFGALGLKGGERRLNVATSRARDKVVIFSSMPIEEISDAHRQRKTPQRPRDFLQSYLLYASAISEGHLDEAESLLNRLHRPNSSRLAAGARHSQRYFVQCVAEFLRKKGFEVDVPAAGDAFAFDLALRNPATGLFALGIECDPPRHPDLAHARDREIWRPQVLEGSLPNVHRVWSRLWLIEPAREQRRLSDAVRKALPTPSPAP